MENFEYVVNMVNTMEELENKITCEEDFETRCVLMIETEKFARKIKNKVILEFRREIDSSYETKCENFSALEYKISQIQKYENLIQYIERCSVEKVINFLKGFK